MCLQGRVKFPTGGKSKAQVRDPQRIIWQTHEFVFHKSLRLIRCDSGTNSIVWMKEERKDCLCEHLFVYCFPLKKFEA